MNAIRPLVPQGFELDLFDGQAWVAVTPFHLTNVAPRATPTIPWVSTFEEINVRTYVRVNDRPGVYFFSLDASTTVGVTLGRALFHLPYFTAKIDIMRGGNVIDYRTRRTDARGAPAECVVTYAPTAPGTEPARGSLEYFLTERYCLFTVDETFHAYQVDIHHPPWTLHPAKAEFDTNTMADAAGIRLPAMAPLVHYARRQDVLVWPTAQI